MTTLKGLQKNWDSIEKKNVHAKVRNYQKHNAFFNS